MRNFWCGSFWIVFSTESIEENQESRTIKEENNYTMQIVKDSRMGTDYLEMWGVLDNGNLFLMRTPMESIRESVRISNRFLLYSGILLIVLGSFILDNMANRISKPILNLANISERMHIWILTRNMTGAARRKWRCSERISMNFRRRLRAQFQN